MVWATPPEVDGILAWAQENFQLDSRVPDGHLMGLDVSVLSGWSRILTGTFHLFDDKRGWRLGVDVFIESADGNCSFPLDLLDVILDPRREFLDVFSRNGFVSHRSTMHVDARNPRRAITVPTPADQSPVRW